MYLPYQVLHDGVPGDMTADGQREADQQLGLAAAAVSRSWGRIAERARALAGVAPVPDRSPVGNLSKRRSASPLPADPRRLA
jgi:hypothetical protein